MSEEEDAQMISCGDGDQRQISRRRFVAGTLVTGAAVAGPAPAQATKPARWTGSKGATVPRSADVVVIGAGFAGLTAAHRLSQAGRSVVVLEARDGRRAARAAGLPGRRNESQRPIPDRFDPGRRPRHWQQISIERDGELARVGPGTVLGPVNRRLARHGRRLGPDPASTNIACVGGVVANNSGGMRCGVSADSYQTVRSMTLVLANGAVIDTAAEGAEQHFAQVAPQLATGLAQLRDELRADGALARRVADKFKIKNTTGYRLCACRG